MSNDGFANVGLWLDLEFRGTQLKELGAFLGEEVVSAKNQAEMTSALEQLDSLASRAEYIAGHNLLRHDLPILRAYAPRLRLLSLPVVDTLLLSPLAFPEHPYHRLVKDYKLVRSSLSDPTSDANLAQILLQDELIQFRSRQITDAPLAAICRAAMESTALPQQARDGNGKFFDAAGIARPSQESFMQWIKERLAEKVCATVLDYILAKNTADQLATPAMGYAVAWLTVAGNNSVLPPWVRREFPETKSLIESLRGTPCGKSSCVYCETAHNPRAQLKKFFGFDDFRAKPAAPDGSSLQQKIVEAGMANRPHLAILPTGGGKSLCYQLPALARHFQQGQLTVVISPLQALMKDQVDNLVQKTGMPLAAALHGMLTPPERGDAINRVQMGDVALLYVAPEQLRNQSFRKAIAQREVGAWIFDEAHCLSKWGHDFRPDYLYASRFIREQAQKQNESAPPVMCFTATAKKEVIEEIVEHFRDSLGQTLEVFDGGAERENLSFDVQAANTATKWERVHELLNEHIKGNATAAAIVYCATRDNTDKLSEYLSTKNWRVASFHAGLNAADKRRIQDEFLANQLQVICATNAFGMGIDKENIRLVLHADIPGSLENYLQEAGRAGRDRLPAKCVLLYDKQDIERQFSMGAFSQLTRQDVAAILRGLRRMKRSSDGEIVITTGELLRDEHVQVGFDAEDASADTKVRTAVALLERSGFIQRNENQTHVFQGRPLVRSVEEARQKMAALNLPASKQAQWEAVLMRFFNSSPDEGFSADDLAELPALREAYEAYRVAQQGEKINGRKEPTRQSEWVMRILREMADAGLVKRDMLLTAFVKHGGPKSPRKRFEKVCSLERAMLDALRETDPDAEGWQLLYLSQLNQRMCDAGHECAPEIITLTLRSLAIASRGAVSGREGIEYRPVNREVARLKLRHDWQSVLDLAERRRAVASLALEVLTKKIPAATPEGEECLVSFGFEEIQQALQADVVLSAQVRDSQQAIERALLFLHEHKIILLQQGLAVFRQAMTVRVLPESHGRRFAKSDFEPLAQYYGQRVFQVHVMQEYARLGLEKAREAIELVLAYFQMDRKEFIRKFFAGRKEMLDRATTEESYARIVDSLRNHDQQGIVTAHPDENLLILAGPGSGKTRVVVHRCAYLLRVLRVPASAILIVCFNRHSANDARKKLFELVGNDARGVVVQTYHSLAMRLAGVSFAERAEREAINFDEVFDRALKLLRNELDLPGMGEDELRERVLAGYRHILVDEYQDIDEKQYAFISALAGRTLRDDDSKLTILAVGDDDQNIYSFRGANVEYIRRFQKDYEARTCHLLENYRSTAHIISAANALIEHNRDRMKTRQRIRINSARINEPAGGVWEKLDPVSKGRVQILAVSNIADQAAAVLDEFQRLRELKHFDWADCAVFARASDELATMRTACEQRNIPVRWSLPSESGISVTRVREVFAILSNLRQMRGKLVRASTIRELLPANEHCNHWHRLILEMLDAWSNETENTEQPTEALMDFLYAALAEERRQQKLGRGILLSTVHGAKGLEYDHVAILGGGWQPNDKQAEEERRLFYVGMTRARQTLTLMQRTDAPHRFLRDLHDGEGFISRRGAQPKHPLSRELRGLNYTMLGLKDFYLDFAGQREPSNRIHSALSRLQLGALLKLRENGDFVELQNPDNVSVAALSKTAKPLWRERLKQIEYIRLIALHTRLADDCEDPSYRQRLRADQWEIPIIEIVWRG
jgi:ATP-dependent DNA helicase RecQ